MARDLKYGLIVVERGSIPDDEPVFVLRAQDALAGETIRFYMKRREQEGIGTVAVAEALKDMEAWPVRKMPDEQIMPPMVDHVLHVTQVDVDGPPATDTMWRENEALLKDDPEHETLRQADEHEHGEPVG